jgi:hypothetical protein
MALTPQMVTELRTRRKVHPIFKWTFPFEVVRLSKEAVNVTGEPVYLPRITRNGTFRYAKSDRRNALQAVEARITVSDADRTLSRILGRYRPDKIRAAEATVRLWSPNVTDGDNYVFRGMVSAAEFNLQRMEYELKLRCADMPLRTRLPLRRIMRADWPRAHDSVIGQPVCQGLYGRFKSDALGVGGALPTQYVDVAEFRYLVCHGRALIGINKVVTRVYVNGSEVTSGWSVEHLTRNGRVYTLIKFTSDQGTGVVTLDGSGYTGVGDGDPSTEPFSAVLEKPIQCMAHWLTNFVWNDYKSGAWVELDWLGATPKPVDGPSAFKADAVLTSWGHVCSKRIPTDVKGKEEKAENILNEWAFSENIHTSWTPDGRLAFYVDDPGRQMADGEDFYDASNWLRGDLHDYGDWSLKADSGNVVDSLSVDWCFLPSQNRPMQNIRIENHLLDRGLSDNISMTSSSANLV